MSAGGPQGEVVVGLDVGTTAVKAAAFDLASGWRHVVAREYPLLAPEPDWRVQDPAVVLGAVVDALGDAAAACAGAPVVAVSLSTAAHGLVGLDDGLSPLTPILTWADGRSRDQARLLRDTDRAVGLHARTGTPVHPMTPLTKLMWFARHDPQTASAVRWWAGVKEIVLARLTGTLATELSSASCTGMLDLRGGGWDAEALELAEVTADRLPPVLSPTQTRPLLAEVARLTGLPAGVPVVLGGADGPVATVGAGAVAPGVVGLSVGTSGAARMLVPQPVTDDPRLFCYALTESHWVLGGAVSNGGSVSRWARGVVDPRAASTSDAEVLALAAAVPAGSDGLVMLPYLLPERAPLWDPDLTGAFLGLRSTHGSGHLVRAAIEGVALQLSLVVDLLDRVEPVTAVRATGGVFRSALWRQVLAGTLGVPLTITTGPEGTALGAAALALVALGRFDDVVAAAAALHGEGGDEAAAPSEADVAAYARVRERVPRLLAAYGPVAALLAEASHEAAREAPSAPGPRPGAATPDNTFPPGQAGDSLAADDERGSRT